MIEDAVRAILLADTAVVALATGGVRTPPLVQVTNPVTQLPAVVYQRISGTEPLTQDGPGGPVTFRVQVDVWAQSYRTARVLARKVRTALHGFPRAGQTGLQAGEAIQLISLVDGSDVNDFDAEVKLHRAQADYRIHAAAEAA